MEDDFLSTIADTVHRFDPCHLMLCFQLLVDALFLSHLLRQQSELLICLDINVSKVAVQLAIENQIGIKHWTVLLDVIQVLPTTDTDSAFFGVWQNQTRE